MIGGDGEAQEALKLESLSEQAQLPGREGICELGHEAGVRWETVFQAEKTTCATSPLGEKEYILLL